MEVHGQPGVILLNDDLSGLFDGFRSNTTLKKTLNIFILETSNKKNRLRSLFIDCRHKI